MIRKIVLSIVAVLMLGGGISFAQNKQVTGRVVDESGTAIAGALVLVEGSNTLGTTTGTDGDYKLMAPTNGTLVVSFMGYKEHKVAIAGKTNINVVLKVDTKSMEEVVVVAFGTATKEAFTGSAKVVKSDDIVKTQSSNVEDALVGKIPGVQFSAASGRPGAGQTLNIRGVGSLSAGNNPLWVVDGVPYEGDINNLNTADIESVSVLKDAASNALYGARGANGVIMVTTKKAAAGEAVVKFDAKWGVNTRALRTYDIVEDAGEWYEMHYASLANYFRDDYNMDLASANIAANELLTSNTAGGVGYNVYTVPTGQLMIGTNGRLNPNATEGRLVEHNGQEYLLKADNWLDEIYKSATFRQEYNVSVSGATERANFLTSLGYLDNTGIIDGSEMERVTARLRADYQAKKWLKVGGNVAFTHFEWLNGNSADDEGASDGGNAFATAIRMAPIFPVYIRDGEGNIMIDEYGMQMYDTGDGRNGGAVRSNGGTSNDLQDIQLNKYISEGNAITANGFADFNLYEGLKLTVNGSINLDETRSTILLNPYYGQFATSGGVLQKGHSRFIAYNLQQLLSYSTTIKDKHNIDVLLGHEMYNRKSYGLSASKGGLFSTDNLELSGAVVDRAAASSSISEYNNEGYFIRAQYDYDGRFYGSASYRRDASSMFHPDNRWGNFWSVGGAWIMDKESWFDVEWVDMLKVKASYGSQGNDNLPYSYLYTDYYTIENDGNGGVTNVLSRKGNPDITWETNTNLNVGIEFSVLGDRLSGNVDFFNRKTTDMLFQMATPVESGYTSIWTNIGDMVNRGVEFDITGTVFKTRDLTWDININATHYKNKLVKLPEQYKNNTTADGKHIGRQSGTKFLTEGESIYAFYIPTYAGPNEKGLSTWYTYKTAEDGTKTREVTTNYSDASANGREMHGDALPDLYGGFGTTLNWKGLDFSANFTYQLGGQVIDSGYQFYMNSPSGTSTGNNYHHDLLGAWTPDNTSSNIPRFNYNDSNQAGTSDRFLTNASYLNIQNITLGYTLPKSITQKFLVQSLRVYVVCDNVWYWSKRQGMDPRQSISGATNPYYYAPIRTFSGGLSVTF